MSVEGLLLDTGFDFKAQEYLEAQLFQVAPLPLENDNYPYGFDMQIRSPGRKTNWLRIDAEKMKKIEQVLRGLE
jgi:hypothetical protein